MRWLWTNAPLRRRIALGTAAVIVVFMTLFVVDLTWRQERAEYAELREQTQALAELTAQSASVWVASRDYAGLQEIAVEVTHQPGVRHVSILGLDGQVLADSERGHIGKYLAVPQDDKARMPSSSLALTDALVPIRLDNVPVGWVRLGMSGERAAADISHIRASGLLYGVLAIVLGTLVAQLASRALTRRLERLRTVMEEIGAGHVHKRVALGGGDEVAVLGHRFDTMLDTLEAQQGELAQVNRRFRLATDSAGIGIWEYTTAGDRLDWDTRTCHQHGLEAAPADRAGWLERVHQRDRDALDRALTEALAGGPHLMHECRIVRPDGRIRWLKLDAAPRLDADGRTEGLTGTCLDVTRLHSERAHSERLLAILRESPDFVGSADLQGRLEYHNPAALRMIGLDASVDLSRFHIREMHPEWAVRRVLDEALPWALKHGKWSGESALLHIDGSTIPVLQSIIAHRDESGEPVWLSTIMHDLRESKAAEQALAQAKSEAEAASQAKSAFLANMSHEIRTPLNAIIGLAYLLGDGSLSLEQRSGVEHIQNAARSLLGIVNDVLDLAKIEAGELALERAPFRLDQLLHELEGLCAPLAVARGLVLELHHSAVAGLPAISGDASRLRQILLNLLNNALKFTETGRVSLVVSRMGETAEPLRLRFEVSDTGIGIEPDVLSSLFQPFTQADVSTTRRFGGTGLGLSIVRQLVERMGGRLGAESRPGVGSTFWVELAFAPADLVDSPVGRAAARPRVVAVCLAPEVHARLSALAGQVGLEFSHLPFERLTEQLFDREHEVLLLALDKQGEAGFAALHSLGDARPASVVLVDSPAVSVNLPHAAAADVLLARDDDASALYNAVQAAWARHGHNPALAPLPTPGRSASLPGVRVLLVDDSDLNLDVARRILEREGAEVHACGDGAAAIDWLQAYGENVDVVLMDVQMPVMDGYAAVRAVRGMPQLAGLPVLALTAGALSSERDRAFEAGMDDYLTKPFDPVQMVQAVRRHVEKRRGRALVPNPTAPAAPSEPPWPLINGIDGVAARRYLLGDRALFLRLLRDLLDDHAAFRAPPALPDTEAGRAALAATLHKLAGSSGTLGAVVLQEACRAGEAALRGDDPDAQRVLADVAQAFDRLASAAAPWLVTVAQPVDNPDGSPPDPARLEQLRELLRDNAIDALEAYREMETSLVHALGVGEAGTLATALDRLDFETALRVLDTLSLPETTPAGR